MNDDQTGRHRAQARLDEALVIIRDGRRSHVLWSEHLRGCPGCDQCRKLGIDWSAEREEDWIAKYDLVESVLREQAAALAAAEGPPAVVVRLWNIQDGTTVEFLLPLDGEESGRMVISAGVYEASRQDVEAAAEGPPKDGEASYADVARLARHRVTGRHGKTTVVPVERRTSMASRFVEPCGCATCGDVRYPCDQHKGQDGKTQPGALAAAECPHGGECGCSIATRHEWYEWKGDERLKREAAEARAAQLQAAARAEGAQEHLAFVAVMNALDVHMPPDGMKLLRELREIAATVGYPWQGGDHV